MGAAETSSLAFGGRRGVMRVVHDEANTRERESSPFISPTDNPDRTPYYRLRYGTVLHCDNLGPIEILKF